jgi:hypothetical protein
MWAMIWKIAGPLLANIWKWMMGLGENPVVESDESAF